MVSKKIIKFIEKNSTFITVISTILFPVLTIFSTLYISNVQNNIQKESSAPIFFLKEDENGTIEILNKGGKVSYFNFKRVTEIYVSVNDKKINLDIYYSDKNRLGNTLANIENKVLWYYVPVLNNIEDNEIRRILTEKIEEIYPEEIFTYVDVKDYYVLSCKDYENSYREFYYIINDNGIGEPYDYVEENYEEDELIISGGMPSSSYATTEEFYNSLEKVIMDSMLHYRYFVGR